MTRFPNAYTDAPELSSNRVLGALQAIFWILFHPSAWSNYIARTAPDYPPDFNILIVKRDQSLNPSLFRLLSTEYFVVPILSSILTALALGLTRVSITNIVFGSIFSAVISYTSLAAGTVGFSVAIGLGVGTSSSLLGIAFAWASTTGFHYNPWIAIAFGLAVGISGSIAGEVGSRVTSKWKKSSLREQIGGTLISIIVGGIMVATIGYLHFTVAKPIWIFSIVSLLSGLAIMLTARLSGDWLPSIGTGIIAGLTTGSISAIMFWIAIGKRVPNLSNIIGAGFGFIIGFGGSLILSVFTMKGKGWGYLRFLGALMFGIVGVFLMMAITQPNISGASKILTWGIMCASLLGVPYLVTRRLGGFWAGIVATALTIGGGWVYSFAIANGVFDWSIFAWGIFGILFGLMSWWRSAILYVLELIWNTILYYLDEQHRPNHSWLLCLNSAFWDENQYLHLSGFNKYSGLDKHLLLVMEQDPVEGEAALQYLSTSENQRWAAREVQIELYARYLENCIDITGISNIQVQPVMSNLVGPAGPLLRNFDYISRDIKNAENQTSAYSKCLLLNSIESKIDSLLRELLLSQESYAIRFQPIADHWRKIVEEYKMMLEQSTILKEEIDNPYIVGKPLHTNQEIFVGRQDISKRVEQLILNRNHLPMLLYGQKRIGKTSLLHNISGYLPSNNIVPLYVDGNGIASASDFADLLYNISKEMISGAGGEIQNGILFPPLPLEQLAHYPATEFKKWLDKVEICLQNEGKTALLILDELESLIRGAKEGRYDATDFFTLLRNLIQHREQFNVLLAGSHTLEEFQGWVGYLNNVQVIKVSYLDKNEALRLITHPIEHFSLEYDTAASERVWELTRGHPCLIQLLCSEIVTRKNEQEPKSRHIAHLDDIELALPEAFSKGKFIIGSLEEEVDDAGLAILRYIAKQGEKSIVSHETLSNRYPDKIDQAISLLLKRDFIEKADGGYRFQVEMIRLWFEDYSGY